MAGIHYVMGVGMGWGEDEDGWGMEEDGLREKGLE